MVKKGGRNRNQSQAEKETHLAPRQSGLPSVPTPVESAETKVVYYKPEEDQEVPKSRLTRWLYYRSQIILSVLTFGILVFYLVQWVEFRRSRELENRAWVATKNTLMVTDPDNAALNKLAVTFGNSGRTPGKNGTILMEIKLLENSPPEDTVVNPPDTPSSRLIFPPNAETVRFIGGWDVPKPPEASPSPVGPSGGPNPSATPTVVGPPPQLPGKQLWYVYGVIKYEDIFGNPHRTKFCYRNVPGSGTWWFCPTYNEAD